MLEVLIVDGDAEVARTLREVLERDGCAGRTAATRDEALECARQRGPDVLLIDFRIPPGYEGMDIAAEIRRQRPGMSVILMTAYPRDDTLETYARSRGAAHLFYRPFDLDDLSKAVRALAAPAAG